MATDDDLAKDKPSRIALGGSAVVWYAGALKPRSPRRDHSPDIGPLARDHARGPADPPRIDIP